MTVPPASWALPCIPHKKSTVPCLQKVRITLCVAAFSLLGLAVKCQERSFAEEYPFKNEPFVHQRQDFGHRGGEANLPPPPPPMPLDTHLWLVVLAGIFVSTYYFGKIKDQQELS